MTERQNRVSRCANQFVVGRVIARPHCLDWQAAKAVLVSVRLGRYSRDLKCNAPSSSCRIKLVHTGDMRVAEPKTVRQSVSLPAKVATQVRTMAKARRLSAARMLVELIENGIEAEKRKQQEFFDLAERFRNESNPDAAKRLGDQLGRMVFGG
jgi:hypothetical protein